MIIKVYNDTEVKRYTKLGMALRYNNIPTEYHEKIRRDINNVGCARTYDADRNPIFIDRPY